MIWRLGLSSHWIDYTASEDIELVVKWEWKPNFYASGNSKAVVQDISECYGKQTGADYMSSLNINEHLLDHLSDLIMERSEM